MNSSKTQKRGNGAGAGESPDFSRCVKGVLLGQIVALLTTLLLSIVAAAVSYAQADPDALTLPLAIVVAAVASLACGFVTARKIRRQPLLCGLGSGALFLLIGFFLSCFLPDALRGQWNPPLGWGMRAGGILFSVLGAILAVNMPGKRKRHRRRG